MGTTLIRVGGNVNAAASRQTPGLKARIPARIIFKLSCFICVALGGMGARGRSHPGVLRSFVQRWLARSFARGVCFSCVFVNECAAAVMSVLAGPLFSTRTTMMISEGSVLHSSLVIGLRGGRALAGRGRRGRQPPPSGPSPPLMASWTTNQSASYKHLHRKRTDLVLLLHPALSGPGPRSHPLIK